MSPEEQNCCRWRATAYQNLGESLQAPPVHARSIMPHGRLGGLCARLGPHSGFYKPRMTPCLFFPHRHKAPVKQNLFSSLYFPFSWGRPSIPFFQHVLLSLPNTCPVLFKCRSFSGGFHYLLLCISPHSECGFSPAGRSDRRIHPEKYEERICVFSTYHLLETKDSSLPLVSTK